MNSQNKSRRFMLEHKRKYYGFTRPTMGKAVNLSPESIKSLEYGRMNPSAATMLKICKVLESEPEELFPDLVCPKRYF
ncbi:hypothetical protein PDENDC454_04159 [Paenibacillus dendritiformis C454]|uniref:HTH cro/C1-type domain-containing protein n=1 Tax=Paenibacillus dendritiformis C454 TaxID=1131935 RepID=H3SBE6_9BACL|nr:helix-turn-helix transcriptional regulator [Paenibacillus dendritiformis]EHQ63629.1 hypothetical protein PDENDC454_04159 [Paenibacillus dendritiformis C454]